MPSESILSASTYDLWSAVSFLPWWYRFGFRYAMIDLIESPPSPVPKTVTFRLPTRSVSFASFLLNRRGFGRANTGRQKVLTCKLVACCDLRKRGSAEEGIRYQPVICPSLPVGR